MPAQLLTEFAAHIVEGKIRVIDLTQTLSKDTPTLELPANFEQCSPFKVEEISHYDDRGIAWYWNNFTMSEHTGTHFDAPIHWVTGKDLPHNSVDTILPNKFIAPAIVIDCSREAAIDADFLLNVQLIEAWERDHGKIPEGAWVLLRTDWSKRNIADYVNRYTDGAHTPGPSVDAVNFMIKRKILGLGVETIGTDAGQAHLLDPPYPAHTLLHGAGMYGLQCLTNLDQLPPTGTVMLTAPLKIANGSGSPLRVLALI